MYIIVSKKTTGILAGHALNDDALVEKIQNVIDESDITGRSSKGFEFYIGDVSKLKIRYRLKELELSSTEYKQKEVKTSEDIKNYKNIKLEYDFFMYLLDLSNRHIDQDIFFVITDEKPNI